MELALENNIFEDFKRALGSIPNYRLDDELKSQDWIDRSVAHGVIRITPALLGDTPAPNIGFKRVVYQLIAQADVNDDKRSVYLAKLGGELREILLDNMTHRLNCVSNFNVYQYVHLNLDGEAFRESDLRGLKFELTINLYVAKGGE